MHPLTQAGLLNLWETGRPLHPLDRGLLAVEATAAESATAVADWPLGRRNRALAELHATMFGRRLRGWTECRGCGERLEFDVDAMALADRGETEGEQYITFQRAPLPPADQPRPGSTGRGILKRVRQRVRCLSCRAAIGSSDAA